jgi:tetratricopeptide (TPR) repeat protein
MKQDIARQGMVAEYRHRKTGALVYIGRPLINLQETQERYTELHSTLEALSWKTGTELSKGAAELYERASELIRETNVKHLRLVWLQGLAARMAGRWSEAERAFRTMTECWPNQLEGWLELTWALASLDRPDEALAAARRSVELSPQSPEALGNLASALVQNGRTEEALPVIQQALEFEPENLKNQMIRDQITARLEPPSPMESIPAEDPPDRPWYRRWF